MLDGREFQAHVHIIKSNMFWFILGDYWIRIFFQSALLFSIDWMHGTLSGTKFSQQR